MLQADGQAHEVFRSPHRRTVALRDLSVRQQGGAHGGRFDTAQTRGAPDQLERRHEGRRPFGRTTQGEAQYGAESAEVALRALVVGVALEAGVEDLLDAVVSGEKPGDGERGGALRREPNGESLESPLQEKAGMWMSERADRVEVGDLEPRVAHHFDVEELGVGSHRVVPRTRVAAIDEVDLDAEARQQLGEGRMSRSVERALGEQVIGVTTGLAPPSGASGGTTRRV